MSKTAEEIAADMAKPGAIVVVCSDAIDRMYSQEQRCWLRDHFHAITGMQSVLLPADATVRVLRLGTGTVDEAKPLNLVALTEEQVRRIEDALRPAPRELSTSELEAIVAAGGKVMLKDVGEPLTNKQLKVTGAHTDGSWEPNE